MRQLTRRQLLFGLTGAAAATTLPSLMASCGGADVDVETVNSGQEPGERATSSPTGASAIATAAESVAMVRFAWWTDVGTPNPFQVSTTGPGGAVLLSLMYDSLTWKDEEAIIPWLASAWEISDDATSYTFQIVTNATWHDGQPLTAEDVAFSFNYYAQFPYKWMTTEIVTTSEAAPGGQVRITLERPHAAFLEDIAGVVPIIPHHVWEAVADPVTYAGSDSTVGSGPFTLAEYNETEGAYRLQAFTAYWRGQPRTREWRQVTVPQEARVRVVQQGEADISLSTDASIRDLLADDPRLQVFETAPLSIVRLVINTTRAPLDRKKVRQAIAYALDRARIAETITRGPAVVGSAGVIPPETPWHHPSLKQYEFDAGRARELLRGETLTIDLIADANAREPDLMQAMLQDVGITLNVQRVDAPTRTQLLDEGNFQLALTSHIGVGGDPDFLRRWYSGEEANAFAKGSIFKHAEFMRLSEEQAATTDPAERREIIVRMQEILAEELPTIVLYHRRFYWLYDAAVFAPMNTRGGLMNGIPFPNNKLALIES